MQCFAYEIGTQGVQCFSSSSSELNDELEELDELLDELELDELELDELELDELELDELLEEVPMFGIELLFLLHAAKTNVAAMKHNNAIANFFIFFSLSTIIIPPLFAFVNLFTHTKTFPLIIPLRNTQTESAKRYV